MYHTLSWASAIMPPLIFLQQTFRINLKPLLHRCNLSNPQSYQIPKVGSDEFCLLLIAHHLKLPFPVQDCLPEAEQATDVAIQKGKLINAVCVGIVCKRTPSIGTSPISEQTRENPFLPVPSRQDPQQSDAKLIQRHKEDILVGLEQSIVQPLVFLHVLQNFQSNGVITAKHDCRLTERIFETFQRRENGLQMELDFALPLPHPLQGLPAAVVYRITTAGIGDGANQSGEADLIQLILIYPLQISGEIEIRIRHPELPDLIVQQKEAAKPDPDADYVDDDEDFGYVEEEAEDLDFTDDSVDTEPV